MIQPYPAPPTNWWNIGSRFAYAVRHALYQRRIRNAASVGWRFLVSASTYDATILVTSPKLPAHEVMALRLTLSRRLEAQRFVWREDAALYRQEAVVVMPNLSNDYEFIYDIDKLQGDRRA